MSSPASSQNAAIVVSSCDAYSDAWEPFFTLFFRYWADCPFPIYLISNRQTYRDSRVIPIQIEDDQEWSGNLQFALQRIPAGQLIYLQEDYFLQSAVSTSLILRLMEFASEQNAGCIRLCGGPDPAVEHQNEFGLGLVPPGQKFRVSLQAAIWQRAALESLLVAGEDGWQMEAEGTRRSSSIRQNFFGCYMHRPIIDYYYFTGIVKGKWVPGACRLCRREGITLDLSRREVHAEWPFLVRRFRNLPMIRSVRAVMRSWRTSHQEPEFEPPAHTLTRQKFNACH